MPYRKTRLGFSCSGFTLGIAVSLLLLRNPAVCGQAEFIRPEFSGPSFSGPSFSGPEITASTLTPEWWLEAPPQSPQVEEDDAAEQAVDGEPPLLYFATPPEQIFDEGSSPGAPESESGPFSSETTELPPLNIPSINEHSQESASRWEDVQSLDEADDSRNGVSLRRLAKEPYTNYRTDESMWSWLPGGGENFGWFSFRGSTYEPRGKTIGLGAMFNVHFLGGPKSSPLPPRLYDFALGMQARDTLSDRFSYEIATSVGVYSDFEGSARDGVRFPSHAVGMVHVNHTTDLVFGVDYLDRDDIHVLPVFGVSLHDHYIRGLRVDLIFPRPRIDYVLNDRHRGYLMGVMDGGTWDIEFPDGSGQVMTYRDYRILLGIESLGDDGGLSAWEFGYAFGRELEFRHNPVSTRFDDAFVLQWVWRN